MAKKKAKKRAKKQTSVMSSGVKKGPKPPKVYTTIGRPKGAKSYEPKGLEVREFQPLARKGTTGKGKKKGLRRVVLETKDEELAQHLERLATLVRKKDPDLLKLTAPKTRSRKAS